MKKCILLFCFFISISVLSCLKLSQDKETIPAAPSNLQAQVYGPHNVAATWIDNSNNEAGFEVEVKTDSGPFEPWFSPVKDVTTYYNDNLNIGHTYTFRVRASNAAGYSAYSNEATAIL